MEAAEQRIKFKIANNWIVDSIPYFYFKIEKKYITIPIIPIFYWIEFQRRNALYKFRMEINNNKIYQSLDSVSYTIYDSFETVYYKGGYKYNINLTERVYAPNFDTPNTINIKLNKTDIVYGDIELFFTDFNNKPVKQAIRKIKFEYDKRRFFMCIFDI
jgi:hypothetical protein